MGGENYRRVLLLKLGSRQLIRCPPSPLSNKLTGSSPALMTGLCRADPTHVELSSGELAAGACPILWLHVPEPAHQALLRTLPPHYPARGYHRATGLLPVPRKESVSIHLWACSHKPQVQKEKSTRNISCWTNQCCYTFFYIPSLMSGIGFLIATTGAATTTAASEWLIVAIGHPSSTYSRKAWSDRRLSFRVVITTRKCSSYCHPVQTPSETANSIFWTEKVW